MLWWFWSLPYLLGVSWLAGQLCLQVSPPRLLQGAVAPLLSPQGPGAGCRALPQPPSWDRDLAWTRQHLGVLLQTAQRAQRSSPSPRGACVLGPAGRHSSLPSQHSSVSRELGVLVVGCLLQAAQGGRGRGWGGKSQRRHGERGDGTAPGAALNLTRKQRSSKPQVVGGEKSLPSSAGISLGS